MRKTRGKSIFTGARRANSSARARRSARSSSAIARSDERADVPRRWALPSANTSLRRASAFVRELTCSSAGISALQGRHQLVEFHIDDSVISAFYASEGFQKVGESGTYMDSLASTWPNAS